MFMTLYLCQVCKKHFAIEGADYHTTNYCPGCPFCESSDDVLEKSIGTLAVLHELHQDEVE
ncbi:hypothetical protein P9G84_22495 [Brevibacillus centrosporus]|uniref:hypothetical protein n=1 Tax=Brevibacillus centrosporus TaxID=54910 RepID=UPI001141AAFB|nr:hypothetical protein [Brevibacillus centrosporus]MEC2131699.1 hypothetical protein [Brevibacillus centrosporus]GED34004.1 hypothetical protein BCE02nite_51450 [Brevibacillus centrosporus]